MSLPSNVSYCTVTGRFLSAVGDGVDAGHEPDGIPVDGLTVTFSTSLNPPVVKNAAESASILIAPVACTTDEAGYLLGPDGSRGVVLVATDDVDLDPSGWTWKATVEGPGFPRITTTFLAPSGGAVDLATVIPVPASPGVAVSQWQAVVTQTTTARDETIAARDEVLEAIQNGGGTGGAVASVNGQTGAITLTATDVGALPASTTIPSTAADVGAVPSTRKVAGKALTGDVTLTASDVGAATAAQGAKADTAVQPAGLTKTAVGLGNVDNTTDASKPISDAQQAALDAKVPTARKVAGKALTADVMLAKDDVGLSNVDNTSDAAKPVSTATQAALDSKGNVIQWVEGISSTPSPRKAGAFYMLLLGADSPVPSWATDYDTIIRVAADQGSGTIPVTATQVAHFESAGSVSTSGAVSIGALPVGTNVLVLIAGGSATPGVSMVNGNGNTWTQLASNTVTSIAGQVSAYVTKTTSAASDTITVNRSAPGGLSVAVFTLEGSDGTIAGAAALSSSETNVTSATSPSVSVAQGGLVVYAVVTALDITALTKAGSTDTVAQFSATGTGNPRTLAVGFDNAVSAGATAPGLSWSSARSWAGITLVFNPA